MLVDLKISFSSFGELFCLHFASSVEFKSEMRFQAFRLKSCLISSFDREGCQEFYFLEGPDFEVVVRVRALRWILE